MKTSDPRPAPDPSAATGDTPCPPELVPFDYVLPPGAIAVRPAPRRSDARMLVLGPSAPDAPPPVAHHTVAALPQLLRAGDLLVVNDTRVMHARLRCRRRTGGGVEVLLLSATPGIAGTVPAMVRPGRRLGAGEVLTVEGNVDGTIELVGRTQDGGWQVRCSPDPDRLMAAAGVVPLPPYLRRDAEPDDAERYQTVYAGPPGAVAAPTAGLHLDHVLLDALAASGIQVAAVTLHVGPGTFRNLRPADLAAGELHAEAFDVSPATAAAVAACRARGGRVIAVGTTVTRVLEATATTGGLVRPGRGETRLFLRPGHDFAVVDGLLTNFHLPRTSLLMLVCALGGTERIMVAYRIAVGDGYRFYSYGDAMLILPSDQQARP